MLWYLDGLLGIIATLTLLICPIPASGFLARPKAYIVVLGETAEENRQLSVSALEGEFLEIKCGSWRDINLFIVTRDMYNLCEHEMHSFSLGTCTDESRSIRKRMKRTDVEYDWFPGTHYIIAAPVDQSIESMTCLNYNLKFTVTVSSGSSMGSQNVRFSHIFKPAGMISRPTAATHGSSTVHTRETSYEEPISATPFDLQTMTVPSVNEVRHYTFHDPRVFNGDDRFHDIRPLPRASIGVSPWSPLNAENHYERLNDSSALWFPNVVLSFVIVLSF